MLSCSGSKIFSTFIGFLKSKNPSDGTEQALLNELSSFNDYLKENVSSLSIFFPIYLSIIRLLVRTKDCQSAFIKITVALNLHQLPSLKICVSYI